MGRNYSTRDFFRQMPNRLLARYFQGRGLFGELDFAVMKETKSEALFGAWLALPEGERNRIDAEFREISVLSCERGFCAIRDEAEWQLRDCPEALAEFVEKMAGLDGHYERAMVTFLDHQRFWKGSTLFCHADSLSYWRKRKGFPTSMRRFMRMDARRWRSKYVNIFATLRGGATIVLWRPIAEAI